MENAEHRKGQALQSHCLGAPRLLDRLRADRARTIATELLDRLKFDSPAYLKVPLTAPSTLQITAEIMGLPETPRFRFRHDTLVAPGPSNLTGDPDDLRRDEETKAAMFEFRQPTKAQRHSGTGDDILSNLCRIEYEGKSLGAEEILPFYSPMPAAGVETTDRAPSSMLKDVFTDKTAWSTFLLTETPSPRFARRHLAGLHRCTTDRVVCSPQLKWQDSTSIRATGTSPESYRPIETRSTSATVKLSERTDSPQFQIAGSCRRLEPCPTAQAGTNARDHCSSHLRLDEAISQLLYRIEAARFNRDHQGH